MSNDMFSGYDGLGAVVVGSAPVQVGLTAEHLPGGPTYVLEGGGVRLTKAGRYEINADMSIISTGGNRTQAQGWITHNGVEIPGTRMLFYCRQLNHGATAAKQIGWQFDEDDVVALMAQRTAGSGTLVALLNGTALTLRRL